MRLDAVTNVFDALVGKRETMTPLLEGDLAVAVRVTPVKTEEEEIFPMPLLLSSTAIDLGIQGRKARRTNKRTDGRTDRRRTDRRRTDTDMWTDGVGLKL